MGLVEHRLPQISELLTLIDDLFLLSLELKHQLIQIHRQIQTTRGTMIHALFIRFKLLLILFGEVDKFLLPIFHLLDLGLGIIFQILLDFVNL